jgi:Mn2+/Fe2+ NRAMP family transporter
MSDRVTAGGRLTTLLAIMGPDLIVMVGDNDAGAFGTYTQANRNYGTTLLWTPLLLIPVLYVNQEMVLRLGAVTGVGHARLLLERFGKFWGAFSVIDLFLLNALTIVTEFIAISLALRYLGVSESMGRDCNRIIPRFIRYERLDLWLGGGFVITGAIAMMAFTAAAFGGRLAGTSLPEGRGFSLAAGGFRTTAPRTSLRLITVRR